MLRAAPTVSTLLSHVPHVLHSWARSCAVQTEGVVKAIKSAQRLRGYAVVACGRAEVAAPPVSVGSVSHDRPSAVLLSSLSCRRYFHACSMLSNDFCFYSHG